MEIRNEVVQSANPAATISDQHDHFKLVYSRDEAAAILGVSVRTIDNLILNDELKVRRWGRRVIIPHESIVQFVRRDHPTVVRVQ